MEMDLKEYLAAEEIPVIVSILVVSASAFVVGGPMFAIMVSSGLTVICSASCVALMWFAPIAAIA